MQFMHTLFVYDDELMGAYRATHFVNLTLKSLKRVNAKESFNIG